MIADALAPGHITAYSGSKEPLSLGQEINIPMPYVGDVPNAIGDKAYIYDDGKVSVGAHGLDKIADGAGWREPEVN